MYLLHVLTTIHYVIILLIPYKTPGETLFILKIKD